MKLDAATTIAKRYAASKAGDACYHAVRVTPGHVEAMTPTGGVVLYVEALETIDAQLYVSADQLHLAAKQAKGATISVKARGGRGLALVLTSPNGRTFTINALPPSKGWDGPAIPVNGWTEVSAGASEALVRIAKLGLKADIGVAGFVRLTPDWVATTRGTTLALAWTSGLVKKPVSVAVSALNGIKAATSVAVVSKRLWVAHDQEARYWSPIAEEEWPDETANALVAACRGPGRTVLTLKAAELAGLARAALAVADNLAEPAILALTTEGLTLALAGATSRFEGSLAVNEVGDNRTWGVEPRVLADYADTVSRLSSGEQYLSLGGPNEPIAVYTLEPIAVELVIMPAYVPESPKVA